MTVTSRLMGLEEYENLKRARDTLYGFILGEMTGFPAFQAELLRYLDLLYETAATRKQAA